MADYYVWSGAAGTGDGSSFTNAYVSLAAALASKLAGDRFFVAHDHVGSYGAATTLAFPGTAANPNIIICINRADSTYATTGVEQTTAGNLSCTGHFRRYGLTFKSAVDFVVNAAGTTEYAEDGGVTLTGTATTHKIDFANSGNSAYGSYWRNATVTFNANSQKFQVNSNYFTWEGGSVVGAFSGNLFFPANWYPPSYVRVCGVDLSARTGTLLNDDSNSTRLLMLEFNGCKLYAGAVLDRPFAPFMPPIKINCSDSGDTNYNFVHAFYEGDVIDETTVVRTGGSASKHNGAALPWSAKLTTTANASFHQPLRCEWMPGGFNEVTGSAKTLTAYIIHDNTVDLTDEEVWLEVEYLGTLNSSQVTIGSDRKANVMSAAAAQAADTSAWTTTGLTNPRKQKLEVTFTPQEQGEIRWRVCLAKAAYTVFVCADVGLT